MPQVLLSVGIDIGTTTTQIVFSRITIENTAGTAVVPDYKITKKEVLYQSKIYFTPLLQQERIDYPELKRIIAHEYRQSGFQKTEVDNGAIIITGETARKENANSVLESLAGFAGDFVVSTAGPDLEAVLAGWGAGVGELSKKYHGNVVNFDIGGGTTNAAVFSNGEVRDTFALDIGGRLLKFDASGDITYISKRILPLIRDLGLPLAEHKPAVFTDLQILAQRLAEMFLELLSRKPLQDDTKRLFISQRQHSCPIDRVSFSGGIAEYIYGQERIQDLDGLIFNDIGPLLGECIRKAVNNYQIPLIEPSEKIRATVIGAGNHTMNISGSTISVDRELLPLKNIPVLKVFANSETEEIDFFYQEITRNIALYPNQLVAIAFRGAKNPKFADLKKIAAQITAVHASRNDPIIVIIENDFAKALGQIILNGLIVKKPLICLDRIKAQGGDYIDIGSPVAGVVPVVIKTLIFNT